MNLYPHQAAGVDWIVRRFLAGHNVLVADEMGLGKTLQAIKALETYVATLPEKRLYRALVIAPKFLVLNWQREVMSYASNALEWFVTNYERIPDDLSKVRPFDFLIVDEAHYIKSEDAQRTRRTRALGTLAKRVMLMTGTPITDRPENVYSLLAMLEPQTWAPPNFSRRSFEDRYCAPRLIYIPLPGGRHRMARVTDGAANVEELASLLQTSSTPGHVGLMLRRFKRDVMKDLPEKQRMLCEIGHGTKQLSLDWQGDDEMVIGKMRRLWANKTAFTEWSKDRKKQGLVNANDVASIANNVLQQEKQLVVFTFHKEVARTIGDLIAEGPRDMGKLITAVVTGEDSDVQRHKIVNAFQAGRIHCLVATMHSLGVGVTLTAARVVLFGEIDPSPATMLQAEDRLHRIGQRKCVQVLYAVEPGTIEARIARIYAKKLETLAEFGHVLA